MTTTTTTETLTTDITLGGETRTMTFNVKRMPKGNPYIAYEDLHIGAAQIGRGTKMHRAAIDIIFFADVEAAIGQRWSRRDIREADGFVFAISTRTTVRNAQARIIDWADKHEGKGTATQQTYYGSI
jgi:hypothetical protein